MGNGDLYRHTLLKKDHGVLDTPEPVKQRLTALVVGWVPPGSRHNPSTFTFTVALVRQLAAVREDLDMKEN